MSVHPGWIVGALLVGLVAVFARMTGLSHAKEIPSGGADARALTWARDGMVAAAQPRAVDAGVEILKAGGSAVDAAIAVNACLAVMEPTSCGPGGDLFAIVWDPKAGRLAGLNASGRAPMALTIDKIRPVPASNTDPTPTIPLYSPYSWTVPGAVDGWFELHARYGKLPMKDVLAPAIRAARDGFEVTPVIAGAWAIGATKNAAKAGFNDVFLMPGTTRAPKAGETFRNPALARTLEKLAAGGRDAYYKGEIAREIVAFSKANDGFFTVEDFAKHRSTWDDPIQTDYRGYTVWEMPPPGQGLAALEMLNILETFDLKAMGRDSADYWHVLVEAKKLAYADRARYYADPEFARAAGKSVPVTGLLSKAYARERAGRIDMKQAAKTDEAGTPLPDTAPIDRRETTYLCTADSSGMMVSLIQSNYTGFGSGYAVPSLGFGLQNRGAQFALDPAHANALAPGKRPFHTIIPAFVTKDGRPWLAFGLMGGDMQAQGHAQALANIIDFGMNIQQAGDMPRFHHSMSGEPTGTRMTNGGILFIEDGLPAAELDELRRRGHDIRSELPSGYGGYQAILREEKSGMYAGATEKRKDGYAKGYMTSHPLVAPARSSGSAPPAGKPSEPAP